MILVALWVNVRVYLPPTAEPDFARVPPKAVAHLAWLRGKLDKGAGESMQRLFPEGYFFTHVLHGLSWVEIGLRSDERRDEAVREARWALERIESPAGMAVFPAELPPGHGMFYSGWRNHLQAGVALLAKGGAELGQLRSRCDALVGALTESPAWPWLASYRNQVWPCDTLPGIHAMCVYDRVAGETRYAEFVARWLAEVSRKLSPEFGMIAHVADPGSGAPLGSPRATSQTIILRFLADIDPAFASEQYGRFQAHFQDRVLGVPAIREYPHGISGCGDVDSGPLIAGISVSATVVGMGVAQIYGDREFSRAISQVGEAVGFPLGFRTRRYLGGVLPVGDAFVIHATAARPWLGTGTGLTVRPTPVPVSWRLGLHLLTVFAGLAMVALWWLRTRAVRLLKRARRPERNPNGPAHSAV